MPSNLGYQFDRVYGAPIETDRQLETLVERDNINSVSRWEGMIVYVKETQNNYILKGGVLNSNWETISSSNNYEDLENKPIFKPVENEYANILELIIFQGDQTPNFIQFVIDASGFPNIPPITGSKYFEYLGTTNGDNTDYRLLSDSESQALQTIPTKTSELFNDGADETSTYVETDELGAVAFSNDYNDLNNKPAVPTLTSELTNDSLFINEQALPQNTVFRGIQSTFTTKASLINLIIPPTGGSFSVSQIEQYIKNFTIVGDEIRCLINVDYQFANDVFRPTFLGENLTHVYDYGNRCVSLGDQVFLDNVNLQEVYLPNAQGDGVSQFRFNTALTKAILPRISSISFSGCVLLNEIDFREAVTLNSFLNCSNLPINITTQLKSIREIVGQDCFKGTPVQNLELPELLTISGNSLRDAGSLISIKAPKLTNISGGAFRNANNIITLDFPLVTTVSAGVTTFEMDGVTLINLPNCKTFGDDSINNDFFNGGAMTGCVLIVNEHLKTSNVGGVNANVQAAITAGMIVRYASDTPQNLSNQDISSLGLYVDDAASAIGGVEVGYAYVNSSTGTLQRRLI